MSIPTLYWRTRRWLVMAGAFGVLYLAVILYMLIPAGHERLQQRAFLEAQRARLEQAEAWASTERLTRARIDLLKQAAQRLRHTDAGSRGLDTILATLGAAASQAGLTVTALRAGEAEMSEQHTAWPLHMAAEGRYHEAGAFIDRLERGSDLLVIDRLELTAPDMRSGAIRVQLDLIRYQLARDQQ